MIQFNIRFNNACTQYSLKTIIWNKLWRFNSIVRESLILAESKKVPSGFLSQRAECRDCTVKKPGRNKSPAPKNIADAFTTKIKVFYQELNEDMTRVENRKWRTLTDLCRINADRRFDEFSILVWSLSDLLLMGAYKYIDERFEADESAFAEVARQLCLGSMRVDALMSFSIFVRPLWSPIDGASSEGLWQCVGNPDILLFTHLDRPCLDLLTGTVFQCFQGLFAGPLFSLLGSLPECWKNTTLCKWEFFQSCENWVSMLCLQAAWPGMRLEISHRE